MQQQNYDLNAQKDSFSSGATVKHTSFVKKNIF
jgi:hypothetical protein